MNATDFFTTGTVSYFKPEELVEHIFARLEKEKYKPGTGDINVDHNSKIVTINRIPMITASEFTGHENLHQHPQFATVKTMLVEKGWSVQLIQHQYIESVRNEWSVSSNRPPLHGFSVTIAKTPDPIRRHR